jgi:hypothetical protein
MLLRCRGITGSLWADDNGNVNRTEIKRPHWSVVKPNAIRAIGTAECGLLPSEVSQAQAQATLSTVWIAPVATQAEPKEHCYV